MVVVVTACSVDLPVEGIEPIGGKSTHRCEFKLSNPYYLVGTCGLTPSRADPLRHILSTCAAQALAFFTGHPVSTDRRRPDQRIANRGS